MVYSSLYTHTNNYKLPQTVHPSLGYYRVLNSSLPYHLVCHNYKVILFRERTAYSEGVLPQKEHATCGVMSVSGYILVATRSRVIKMRVNKPIDRKESREKKVRAVGRLETVLEWGVTDVDRLELYNEQFVFMFRRDGVYVYQFSADSCVGCLQQGNFCANSVLNYPRSTYLFYRRSIGI